MRPDRLYCLEHVWQLGWFGRWYENYPTSSQAICQLSYIEPGYYDHLDSLNTFYDDIGPLQHWVYETGRQEEEGCACVWQNWQGYYLRVLSQSSLIINVFCSFTKRSAKKGQEVWRKVFSNNYFHVCHGRFAVFFSLPSCCVSSGCHSVLGCQTCPLVKRIDPSTMFVCLCVCFFQLVTLTR